MSHIPVPTNGLKTRRATAIAYGIACHTLFAVGVGTMIVAMFFGMSRSLGRIAMLWSVVTNALLVAQFPILHSLLVSEVGAPLLKRLAPAAIGSRMATTTYVILALMQVFLLFALWTPSGIIWWRAEGVMLGLMTGLYAGAWLLLLKAMVASRFVLELASASSGDIRLSDYAARSMT